MVLGDKVIDKRVDRACHLGLVVSFCLISSVYLEVAFDVVGYPLRSAIFTISPYRCSHSTPDLGLL